VDWNAFVGFGTNEVYEDLEASLRTAYPEADWSTLPIVLRYGSWIGGDRDGNPSVTAEVTWQTLATLHQAALEVYVHDVAALRDHLTQSTEESALAPEADDGETIFARIQAEHARTAQQLCAVTEQAALLDNTPVLQRSIARRNPYVDPLNFIQVTLLRALRQLTPDTPQYHAVLRAVLATINGIAAGMKTTG
jgi:phosphoenolpyruvate carboxylase